MPYSYSIDPARRLVHMKAEGRLTPQGVHDCIEAYLNDPAFAPSFDLLVQYIDIAGVNSPPADPVRFTSDHGSSATGVIEKVKRLMSEHRADSEYRAVVAGGPARRRTTFVAAMGLIMPEVETASFATVEEALAWLGH